MNDIASDRVGPMQNPPHLGELIRESMDDVGWNVTETTARLGCERGTLSRLLNRSSSRRRPPRSLQDVENVRFSGGRVAFVLSKSFQCKFRGFRPRAH